ncbi:DUF1385 domain-containing protein [Abyssicoccus albus]|uniref:DUF1385 domain-containing protein n=1 Tax=Abyssicoccus albus TaxID=1817405 RepID=UPI00097E3EA4|nr:DUF1385 domain-containing protein [Abyssicoccus albus]AQL56101.1 hypothetical protein BVH56_03800 [Abyssicoccus albus]
MTKKVYGGQAVMEGVMFTDSNKMVTAIRRNDHSIDYFELDRVQKKWVKSLKKIPVIRGFVALIESSMYGMKHMDFASSRYDVDPKDDHTIKQSNNSLTTIVFTTVLITIISLFIGKGLFTVVPALVADWFEFIVPSHIGQVILETLIKLLFLIIYLFGLSLIPDIRRLFQYHGAEHKVINCYEQNLPLTISNVQQSSRLHYRCGSSFILFTVFIGFIVFLFVPTDPLWLRIVYRIILIPLIIGLSFELLQLTNAVRNIKLLSWLGYPGLWVQLLTTKQPNDEQVEVAIHSFNYLLTKSEMTKQQL